VITKGEREGDAPQHFEIPEGDGARRPEQ